MVIWVARQSDKRDQNLIFTGTQRKWVKLTVFQVPQLQLSTPIFSEKSDSLRDDVACSRQNEGCQVSDGQDTISTFRMSCHWYNGNHVMMKMSCCSDNVSWCPDDLSCVCNSDLCSAMFNVQMYYHILGMIINYNFNTQLNLKYFSKKHFRN